MVAPNYAGYDRSELPCHPFLNGDQQGQDVADALTAARKSFASANAQDSGVLLITGYSQDGYVTMAAHRELQARGQKVLVSAPLAGPTAIGLNMDLAHGGQPGVGTNGFIAYIRNSWQKEFDGLYNTPDDIFEAQNSTGIETLLPAPVPMAALVAAGKLPAMALFALDAVPGPASARVSTRKPTYHWRHLFFTHTFRQWTLRRQIRCSSAARP